jgi:hypothetical protein
MSSPPPTETVQVTNARTQLSEKVGPEQRWRCLLYDSSSPPRDMPNALRNRNGNY